MMSDKERERFHNAVNTLKRNGKYGAFVRTHSGMSTSSGAHWGPAFLPWHREFIKQFELELRRIDPELYLPYWDSTLESRLPEPKDSSLFTRDLIGTAHGTIVEGPFAYWRTNTGASLQRQVGDEAGSHPIMDSEINPLLQTNNPAYFFAAQPGAQECRYYIGFNTLEIYHGLVHSWIGGQMYDPWTSANDPIFFLHHSFIDLIWEEWRTRKQNRQQRESVYPEQDDRCSSPQHAGGTDMQPFASQSETAGIINKDGLSNEYTDELYEYAPRPTCGWANRDCGSRFLFCDVTHGSSRCLARIRYGGNCTGYERIQNACLESQCEYGVCRKQLGDVRRTEPTARTTTKPPKRATITARPTITARATIQAYYNHRQIGKTTKAPRRTYQSKQTRPPAMKCGNEERGTGRGYQTNGRKYWDGRRWHTTYWIHPGKKRLLNCEPVSVPRPTPRSRLNSSRQSTSYRQPSSYHSRTNSYTRNIYNRQKPKNTRRPTGRRWWDGRRWHTIYWEKAGKK